MTNPTDPLRFRLFAFSRERRGVPALEYGLPTGGERMATRVLCWLVGIVVLVAGNGLAAVQSAVSASPERTAINRYCVSCHNDRSKTGGLSLASVDPADAGANAAVWEAVLRKLRARAMPPATARVPTNATYAAARLVARDRSSIAPRPRIPIPDAPTRFRRLTRTEYQNAIRDLCRARRRRRPSSCRKTMRATGSTM